MWIEEFYLSDDLAFWPVIDFFRNYNVLWPLNMYYLSYTAVQRYCIRPYHTTNYPFFNQSHYKNYQIYRIETLHVWKTLSYSSLMTTMVNILIISKKLAMVELRCIFNWLSGVPKYACHFRNITVYAMKLDI